MTKSGKLTKLLFYATVAMPIGLAGVYSVSMRMGRTTQGMCLVHRNVVRYGCWIYGYWKVGEGVAPQVTFGRALDPRTFC